MPTVKAKKTKLIILITGLFISWYGWRVLRNEAAGAADLQHFDQAEKSVTLIEGGLTLEVTTQAETVGEFLQQQKINLGDHDMLVPAADAKLFSGTHIFLTRAKKITISEGGGKTQVYALEKTVEEAVWNQKNIILGEDDLTIPSRPTLLADGMAVAVTHVLIKEETVEKPIDFKTVTNEDDDLSWRIKKTTQKGEKGTNEVTYKVVYHDGKEISRKILEQNVTKKPVDEIVTQGTYVKLGKSHTGVASWYAYTGTMAAANPWLPLGSYVKVTNKDNGKSVIVKINDRGPFGNGRIIDLDKVAFAKIADLGAGVANIKMEVVTN